MDNRYSQDLKPGKRLISFFMVLFVLTLGIGIGTLVSYRVGAVAPGDSQLRVQGDGKPLVGGAALALSQAFEEVARLVEPAVVNINTEAVIKRQTKKRETPEREDPMEDFFRRFFNNPNLPDNYTRQSLGSGVIVDPKGYIITNSHVVEGATKIKVSLKEGQQYTAQIIAADSLSDIAVIKIEGTQGISLFQDRRCQGSQGRGLGPCHRESFRSGADRDCGHYLGHRPGVSRCHDGGDHGDAIQRLSSDRCRHQSG